MNSRERSQRRCRVHCFRNLLSLKEKVSRRPRSPAALGVLAAPGRGSRNSPSHYRTPAHTSLGEGSDLPGPRAASHPEGDTIQPARSGAMASLTPEPEPTRAQPTENKEQPTQRDGLPIPLERRPRAGGAERHASGSESPSQAPVRGSRVVSFLPWSRKLLRANFQV